LPMTELDDPFTPSEFAIALSLMRNNKAPGFSGVPIEVIKDGMDAANIQVMLDAYNDILRTGVVPQSMRNSYITVLHKTGKTQVCANYRGLCINEHFGKLLGWYSGCRTASRPHSVVSYNLCPR
jgi:hypothetical protein